MKILDIYKNKFSISFEIFPPKDGNGLLLKEIEILKSHNPAFVSLTYGAGGQENKSFELITKIQNTGLNVMPHFTCITSSKKNIETHLKNIENIGIKNILALRGDIPEDKDLIKHDFHYANELVRFIKEKTDLSIGVAGYPETHIESPDIKTDIENLKRKVDAGADVIFTQLFFDNDKYYKFVERVNSAGIDIPVIPGIMPVISEKQILKMTNLARITIPEKLQKGIEKFRNDKKSMIEFGIEYSTAQCEDLINSKVKGLHFFTLNKAFSSSRILDNIRR